MLLKQCLLLGALATLTCIAAAQQAPQQALQQLQPMDADAVVAAPAYASAFTHFRSISEAEETPDRIWRAANDVVGRLGGHAGHMNSAAATERPAAPPRHAPMHHGHRH